MENIMVSLAKNMGDLVKKSVYVVKNSVCLLKIKFV